MAILIRQLINHAIQVKQNIKHGETEHWNILQKNMEHHLQPSILANSMLL